MYTTNQSSSNQFNNNKEIYATLTEQGDLGLGVGKNNNQEQEMIKKRMEEEARRNNRTTR